MNNQKITLMHPKGKGQVTLSMHVLGLSTEKGNYVVRCDHKSYTRTADFNSYKEANNYLKTEESYLIAEGYFIPLPNNKIEMVDYEQSLNSTFVRENSWNTMDRMPVDKAFFNDHYIREVYDGHHVLIKLSPSENKPFTLWDGRGTYATSDSLLSKLSMLHAYIGISNMTINATLTNNGDIVINEALHGDSSSNIATRRVYEKLRIQAAKTPLSFLRFAQYFSTPEQWSKRNNKAAYASFSNSSSFAEQALKYYFPSGVSHRVVFRTLYELHATSEHGDNEISLLLSKTPFISQLNIGERFVVDGQRIFIEPMFHNAFIFTL